MDSVVQRYKLYRYSYVAPLFPKKSPQSLHDFASVYQCGIVLTGDNPQPGRHTRKHSSPPPCDSRSIASLGKELPTVFNDDPRNRWIPGETISLLISGIMVLLAIRTMFVKVK